MKIPFITEIDRIHSIDSIFLSKGEYSGIIEKYLEKGDFNIYFISYVEKFRFDLDKLVIEQGRLKIKLMGKQDIYTIPNFNILSIDKTNSTSRNLHLTTIEGNNVRITVNEFITNYCQDISRNQELIYIGQSKAIEDRLKNHEKLIRAFAFLPDNKEVLINFVKPSFGYADTKNNRLIQLDKATIERSNFKIFDYQELINFTERVLVKFFQPILNSNFLNTDFSLDNTVQKIKGVSKNEIFIFSNQIDDNGYNFYTPKQALNTSTFILNSEYEFEEYTE